MSGSATVATMEVLRDFGFQPGHNPLFPDGLVYHFENFDLEAANMVNQYAQKKVGFSGFLERTARVMYAPIEFWIPTHVISSEQCAALIAYYLHVPILNPPWWLVEGRKRKDLLPWMIDGAARKAAYDAESKCFVQRDWLRLAVKNLSVQIESASDDMPVTFQFGDNIFQSGVVGIS